MEQRKPITHINIELDQTTLGVVVDAFTHMLENPDEVDLSMGNLSSLSHLQGVTDKLKSYQGSEDPVAIPMDFGDWTTYSPYIDYASTVVPNDEDGVVLEDLHYKYLEFDEQGQTPSP